MSRTEPRKEPLTLTDYMRRYSAGVVNPLVTLLARLGVSPNLLTLLGMALHGLFAWLVIIGEMRWAALAIFIFVPLDSLDGALARRTGRQDGNFGAFLDSTSDRIAEIILFAGFVLFFVAQDSPWLVLATYAALGGSIMVSYARSRAEALGISCKVGLLTRVERYVVLVAALVFNRPDIGMVVLAVGTWFTVAQRVHRVWAETRRNPEG
jgi:CDP-diacylglycerol---glycerol-3-phosphate 3-phosphatidyltransferase